jgi:nicotinamidase-related amidase
MTVATDTARPALLVMDVQTGIVPLLGDVAGPYLERLSRAIEAARGAKIPIIYVTVEFRAGYPEVSPRNKGFSAAKAAGRLSGAGASAVHEAVAPQPGDIQVVKRRVSAFTGSDLEVVLRGQEIDTLILTGIATSGVVLSTLRQAADMDYRLVVLADLCADADEEVHRVLTGKVFPRQADVITGDEWIGTLDPQP